MNNNEGTWRDRRDDLFDRVVQRGRARKRRRGIAVGATVVASVLALAGGLFLPGRDDHSVTVAGRINGTTTVPAPTGVLLIGDQVMLGAKSAIENTIAGADIDAVPGRTFGQATPVLTAAKQRGALPPTIVIHLGNNWPSGTDPYDRIAGQFESVMDAVGSDSEVYFVAVTYSRSLEGDVNSALYAAPWQFPNAHVLAWPDFSRSHADWFVDDGIHLTPVGQTAYAEFLRDGIRPPVTTYSDPFLGGPIPPTGLVLTDDGKRAGEREAVTFEMKLLDDAGNELGVLPRGAIDTDVTNVPRHVLVVTDDGIHLEAAPIDAAGDLPSGCTPTEKHDDLAVAVCGSESGYNVQGERILVNNGTRWRELIGDPPVPAGGDLVGHWAWASPSPDGRWVAASWSGACEVPTGFLVSVADGSVHTVTGEAGVAWWGAPNSGIIGWHPDGSAMGVFGGEAACGTSAPEQHGVYLVSPDTGSRRLLIALTPSQGLLRWTSVDDQRTGAQS